MSAFKYQWNQTIDVGTAGLSKQWTSIRHILSLLVTANACVHVTAYVAVRRSLSTTYTAVVLGLLLRQYVSYQFGVWAALSAFMLPGAALRRNWWTACRDGPLGCTFETNGTDSWRRLFQNSVRAGRGRPVVTGRWDGLLKQMARLPYADCFKSQPDRVMDGRSWRAAGMDFWNKRRGFFTPIVAKVHQGGPWGRAVDGWPWRAAGMDFWNKRHGFLAPIVAEIRQSGPWTAGRDGLLRWTFETNGTDSWRWLFQKSVRSGRAC